jgi:hypothetical protein
MAHDLDGYGADALVLLASDEEQSQRYRQVPFISIPARLADALMALLLALPRRGNPQHRRRQWSIDEAQNLFNIGMSKRKIAKTLAKRAGISPETIRPRLHGLKKSSGAIKPKKPRG